MKRSLLSQEQIITAIQTCARKLGHPPSRAELTRMTGIAWHPIWTEFRGMRGALRAAGLEPGPKGEPPEKAALLLDWAGVVRRVQQLPSRRQYAECGRYSSGTLHRRFKWSLVPRQFYRLAHELGIQAEWADVLEYLSRKVLKRGSPGVNTPRGFAKRKTPSPGNHAADGTAASSVLIPAVAEAGISCATNGKFASPHSIQTAPAILNSADRPGPAAIVDREDTPLPFLADRLVYGAPLSLPALAHAPVNEHGVIFLFGILAERMGFRVESIHGGYPDCEAKRLVEPGRWQRVLIEFEFLSRNFKEHEHDPDLCDIIVCWRHNWIQCPRTLEVIELSKVLAALRSQ